ncbi:phosphoserine phosphatase SerB [Rheinheimera sp. MMS21-TC3]|uniref:phosphoserine phosphatase SerB n=1 Tax=Rheinheimera sp. MMS21-TC3 TaxID=3072790 RepID=UPI0028C3D9A5|nr:phosphoserine phosphatase SerB [Rheinheimera sp. MMS21-TC3]WNO61504.1 phosphoserine phosphatase SerB [Rheinheimera sp. MMS21-TC3]
MTFLYQISVQPVVKQAKVVSLLSILQLEQHYRLSSKDNQLLLHSSIMLAGLTPAESNISMQDKQVNAVEQSNLAKLRLFGEGLNWHLLQQVINIVAAEGDFLPLRCIKPHVNLAVALELALLTPLTLAMKQQLNALTIKYNVEQLYLPSRPLLAQPGLLVMDMDSTAIAIECIDEIANLAGVGAAVAKITAQAMNGELDFKQSLIARVGTLKGADSAILAQVLESMPIMAGLADLVSELQQYNWKIAIASGGFTYFTQALQQRFSLTETFANQLEIIDDKLTGKVIGDIVDAQKKAKLVELLAKKYHILPTQTVAIGDGANDIPMLKTAKYGVAFHAKAAVQAQAKFAIKQGSLLQLLYLFDY